MHKVGPQVFRQMCVEGFVKNLGLRVVVVVRCHLGEEGYVSQVTPQSQVFCVQVLKS